VENLPVTGIRSSDRPARNRDVRVCARLSRIVFVCSDASETFSLESFRNLCDANWGHTLAPLLPVPVSYTSGGGVRVQPCLLAITRKRGCYWDTFTSHTPVCFIVIAHFAKFFILWAQ
jgi:hypothetical protein